MLKYTKILIITMIILMFSIVSVSSVVYNGQVIGYGNVLCTVNVANDFSVIETSSDGYIKLSDYKFYITSDNSINLTLTSFTESTGLTEGQKALSFTIDDSSGLVYFNISGLVVDEKYKIWSNGAEYIESIRTSPLGWINFTITDFNSRTVDIYVFQSPGSPGGGYVPGYIECYKCDNSTYEYIPTGSVTAHYSSPSDGAMMFCDSNSTLAVYWSDRWFYYNYDTADG